MTPSLFSSIALVLLALSSQTSAHGVITGVAGANGVQGAGFGVIATTPRDGSTRNPFEQDTSIIRDREISSGKTGACGRTLAGGNNDVQTQLAGAVNAGLPTTSANGQLSMTLHQVNGDGAGPFTCEVSTDGGNTFQPATVVTDVPGNNGRSKARAQDFPLVMQVATTTACAGGPNGNACIARCRNPAQAGPFGGCVAFAMGGATATESNTTAAQSNAAAAQSNTTIAQANDAAAQSNATATDASISAAASSLDANASDAAAKAASTGTAAAATTNAGTGGATGDAVGAAAAGAGAGTAAAALASKKAKGAAAAAGAGGVKAKIAGALGKAKKTAGGLKGKKAKANARRFATSGRIAKRQDEDMDPLDLDTDDVVSGTTQPAPRKRVINSRIAGRMAGYWIDA